MPEPTTICPACDGRKGGVVLFDGVRDGRRCGWSEWRECPVCAGAGELSESVARGYTKRHAAGEAMRADRLSRGLNVRQEAQRLGISPKELSDLESGRTTKEALCG